MSKFTKVNTDKMVENVDFEVVSFYVVDREEAEFYSFSTYFKENIMDHYENKLDKKSNFINQIIQLKENGDIAISKTPFPSKPDYFLKSNDGAKIDIDIATVLGMGAVRILTGEFAGEFMVYHIRTDEDMHDELIRLALYTLLTDKNADSVALENLVKNNQLYIVGLMMCDLGLILDKIYTAFESRKGGNNVVQFKKK